MKSILVVILFLTFLTGGKFLSDLSADPPAPPASGHGGENNQPPAEAPIDGGVGVLFVLGAAYAGIKFYKNRSDCKESR